MTKLSVIVPVYNVEKYLEKCIDSILRQTFTEFELILVNDGSTDKSGLICEEYVKLDKRVKVIHKNNGGLSSARNAGLDIANGEYIGFIDSDDYIDPNMLNQMYITAKNYNADIVSCRFLRINENEQEDIKVLQSTEVRVYDSYKALEEYLSYKDENLKDIHTVVWNKIYKRHLFNNIKFPEGKIFEDGYVTYRLIHEANQIAVLNNIYYYYVQRSNSIMKKINPIQLLNTYDDWCLIYRFLMLNYPNLASLAANRYIKKCINLYIQLNSFEISEKDRKRYKVKIEKDLNKDYTSLMKMKVGLKNKFILFLFKHVKYETFKYYYRMLNEIW